MKTHKKYESPSLILSALLSGTLLSGSDTVSFTFENPFEEEVSF